MHFVLLFKASYPVASDLTAFVPVKDFLVLQVSSVYDIKAAASLTFIDGVALQAKYSGGLLPPDPVLGHGEEDVYLLMYCRALFLCIVSHLRSLFMCLNIQSYP
jgi:hypothetical protein